MMLYGLYNVEIYVSLKSYILQKVNYIQDRLDNTTVICDW